MIVGLNAANAAKAYLATKNLTGLSLYSEFELSANDDGTANYRDLPCVVCYTSGASEYPPRSGNWNLNLHFKLVVSADDLTAGEFVSVFGLVFDGIQTDTIFADINAACAAADPQVAFTAFGPYGDVQQSDQRIEGRNRVVEFVLPINCCPSIVS